MLADVVSTCGLHGVVCGFFSREVLYRVSPGEFYNPSGVRPGFTRRRESLVKRSLDGQAGNRGGVLAKPASRENSPISCSVP